MNGDAVRAEPMAVRWEAPSLAAVAPPPSLAELESIERSAREEGFSRGYADGIAQAQGEMRRTIARLEGLIDALARPLAELDVEITDALARLAATMAGALLRETYVDQPERLAALAAEAIASVGDGGRALELRLHPDDLEAIRPLLATDIAARLTPDPGLARGDVRVHAENVRIDARLATRLERIVAGRPRGTS